MIPVLQQAWLVGNGKLNYFAKKAGISALPLPPKSARKRHRASARGSLDGDGEERLGKRLPFRTTSSEPDHGLASPLTFSDSLELLLVAAASCWPSPSPFPHSYSYSYSYSLPRSQSWLPRAIKVQNTISPRRNVQGYPVGIQLLVIEFHSHPRVRVRVPLH